MSPTEKIADIQPPCMCPDHKPPSMVAWRPGVYKHTCPSCGAVMIFTVPFVR